MTTSTLLLLVLSLLIAGILSYFQYLYKAKNKPKLSLFLAFFRFTSIFCLFLLLLNPIISRDNLVITKTPLAIVVDNSSSIAFLKNENKTKAILQNIQSNTALNDKFDVQVFQFSEDFSPLSNIDFRGSQTNIDLVANNLKSIFKNTIFPTVLLTDGNQTLGNDYVYSFDPSNRVFPFVVGDTATYLDFKINQLNVNKYAFHKNKFPVEVFLQYSGSKTMEADFSLSQGKTILNKQSMRFSPSKRTQSLTLFLPADKIGLQLYKATISSKVKEKNTFNNVKNFAVDVIDQKTNIAIVSAINHPDLGALKRAIEANVQRKVTVVKPNDIKDLTPYSVLILYQPNSEFKSVFDANTKLRINSFIITGNSTDFNFLNNQQTSLNFKMSGQKEDYLPVFNTQFKLFDAENIGFENFPPLQNPFGTITTNAGVTVLLSSRIRVIDTQMPLLVFAESQFGRNAFLMGENSWKWRLQSHVTNKSFEKYDVFLDKIIQFLASNNSKKSLVVEHERFYNSGEPIEITAQFFNKNYEFDEKARLSISLKNKGNKQTKNYDLVKGNNTFKVNLDGLKAGSYDFTVQELNSKTSYTGSFEILDFDIEKQFVNSDVEKLSQLATHTSGKVFFANQEEQLIKTLLDSQEYKAIQKSNSVKTPLIDWIWLLIIIAISLATEWFVRKYNGLL
ncbi:hypothetical protein IQ05_01199 [Flavobacterium tiangeerense]|uniref:VWA domain-containing protein n=1 Tax=Flavobacterium tiangeerense TaxID=459471 RepID=A0ABY3FKM8_9FLAO|nr:hypothetical protein [Flavobacterium tiangeerense]TWI00546.1 hypothetical protein IQ05_01199 [Flavobacterium tiangeerense]